MKERARAKRAQLACVLKREQALQAYHACLLSGLQTFEMDVDAYPGSWTTILAAVNTCWTTQETDGTCEEGDQALMTAHGMTRELDFGAGNLPGAAPTDV